MHRQIYPLKWDVKKGQELHKKHIQQAKCMVDATTPKAQLHLITNAKKHELEEDRFAEIERENAVLLSKMSKIMREGPGTSNNGGAPEKHVMPMPLPPKSLNRGFRRKELERITQENLSILKRIQVKDPHYNHLEWKEMRRQNKTYMRNACELPSPRKSRFVDSLLQQTGAKTTRTHRKKSNRARKSGASTERTFNAPVRQQPGGATNQVRPDDIKLLLGMRRPPELVKKVFSALMLLVSPFETSEADICWDAVQQWLVQLKGVQAFVDNLNHFDAHIIEKPVITRTVEYLLQFDLYPDKVALFSAALASLSSWIWGICEEAVPGISEQREAERKGPSIASIEEDAAAESLSPVPAGDSLSPAAPAAEAAEESYVAAPAAEGDSSAVDPAGLEETEQDFGFANGAKVQDDGAQELTQSKPNTANRSHRGEELEEEIGA